MAYGDFVRVHFRQLPVFVSRDGQAEVVAERQGYLLFDRMVAFHVLRGVTVPLSLPPSSTKGSRNASPSGTACSSSPEQIAEYDRKRLSAEDVLQIDLFVVDEATAIQWLKQRLAKKPQTFQDIHPQFLKEIAGWQKHEKLPELSEIAGA